MNKVLLLGNITNDLELKKTQSSKSYVRFTIAINEMKDKTTFIDCTAWDKNAELINQFFGKGSKILIEGKISVNNYQSNDGTKRKDVSVLVDRFEFVESKKSEPTNKFVPSTEPTYGEQQTMNWVEDTSYSVKPKTDIDSDCLPFY